MQYVHTHTHTHTHRSTFARKCSWRSGRGKDTTSCRRCFTGTTSRHTCTHSTQSKGTHTEGYHVQGSKDNWMLQTVAADGQFNHQHVKLHFHVRHVRDDKETTVSHCGGWNLPFYILIHSKLLRIYWALCARGPIQAQCMPASGRMISYTKYT